MSNRYTPWWLPTALIFCLLTIAVLFALLVLQKANKGVTPDKQTQNAQTSSNEIFHWRLVTTWPKKFPGLGLAPENFADMVREMSHGRLDITVHGANEIVPALGVFDAVSSGSVEMGHGAAYYWKGKIAAAPFFTTIPFGMNVLEYNGWLHYGGGMELWREIYAPFNLIPFAGGNTGVQMGGWFNREIHSVEDLKGLKMRIPGYGGEVFTQAGGTAVNIPGGELYTSLQSGVIDATEWVGPYNDRAFGFQEIAKYYYYPGWHEPGPTLEFIINDDAFARLPKDLQKMVEVATRAVNQDMMDEYTARNNTALVDLIENQGVELRRFPDDVLQTFKRISTEIYEKRAQEDETFAKVYQSYKAFLDGAQQYHKLTEQAYFELR